jgi:hypothetical protein
MVADVELEHDLAQAILRTLLYADLFDFPLTLEELHRYLAGFSADIEQVENVLRDNPRLTERIVWQPPYVAFAGRQDAILRRKDLATANQHLWRKASRYGPFLAAIPFVRLVTVTGALAAGNSRDIHDDIDLLIVTVPGRLWLARLLAILLGYLASIEGVTLCPNYILTLDTLAQDRHSIYTAHELAQLVLLYGVDVLRALYAANNWAQEYLPNAYAQPRVDAEVRLSPALSLLKAIAEKLLAGAVGDRLEEWERRRKVAKLSRLARQRDTTAAFFGSDCCKGHMQDHGRHIERLYTERLAQAGLTELGGTTSPCP